MVVIIEILKLKYMVIGIFNYQIIIYSFKNHFLLTLLLIGDDFHFGSLKTLRTRDAL